MRSDRSAEQSDGGIRIWRCREWVMSAGAKYGIVIIHTINIKLVTTNHKSIRKTYPRVHGLVVPSTP